MSIPKGGRGKVATYKTVQVRCPEPVKDLAKEIIKIWHDSGQPGELRFKYDFSFREYFKARLGEESPDYLDDLILRKKLEDKVREQKAVIEKQKVVIAELEKKLQSKNKTSK